MARLYIQAAVLVAVIIIYRIASAYIRERQFKAFARSKGCGPLYDTTGPPFSGWRRLRRILNLKNSGEDILDDIIAEDFKDNHTHQKTVHDGSVMLATIEPENLKAMLATQFDDYATGTRRYHQLSPVLGKSIFTTDGPFWAHSRALLRPQFSRDNINDLESTDHAATALIKAIGATNEAGWTNNVDVQPLLYNFTLDTASDFLFGSSVESQTFAMNASNRQPSQTNSGETAAEQATSQQFLEDFVVLGDYLLRRIRLQSLYWLGDSIRFRKAISNVHRFTGRFVESAVKIEDGERAASKKYNLLSALATQTQNQTELRDQTLSVLFAGRDTTAGLLGWCLIRLTMHRDIFAKLRSVVLQDFVPGEPITFAKLKGCRALQHFINEVLRLHPNVPINNRVAARDTTLPVGGANGTPVAVRKGQVIVFSVYLTHRRKDLWGEDALEFNPDRWEQRIPSWQFLPFSGGPRICLGQQFALTETSYVLVRMLQHFDAMEAVDLAQMSKLKKGLGLAMWPHDGVKVRLHAA